MSPQEVVFVITLDQGKFAEQALLQCKSILKNTTYDNLFVYRTRRGLNELSSDAEDFLDKNTITETGEVPLGKYPISTKVEAAKRARERYPEKKLIVLDTDLLVLDNPVISKGDWDLALTPVNMADQEWGKRQKLPEWEKWRTKFDIAKPTTRVKSTTDKKVLPFPMYNVGMMIIKPTDFIHRWEKIRNAMYDELGAFHFLHQISASLLASDYQIEVLSEEYNYPLNIRFYCPDGTKVLHYHEKEHLLKPKSRKIRKKLSQLNIGIESSTRKQLISYLWPIWRRFIPKSVKSVLKELK